MRASMITTPLMPAARASSGYTGRASVILIGGLMLPPTRSALPGSRDEKAICSGSSPNRMVMLNVRGASAGGS